MSVNKVFLEKCGLSVGATQLNASGCGVTVGQNLEVNGTLYTNNLQPNRLAVSNWTTSTRPTNPVNGAMGYNTQLATVEYYFNGNWFSVSSRSATGYLITIVAIGGGGGGGSGGSPGCGGGGGGLGQTALSVQPPATFVVTVGASGAACAVGGTDSYFCSPTVVKGGGGAGGKYGRKGGSYYGKCTGSPGGNGGAGSGGYSGGSGGGAGGYGGTGACGTPAMCSSAPQTYPSGTYAIPGNHGGGGGGGGTNGNFSGGSPGSYAASGANGGGTGVPFPGASGAGGLNNPLNGPGGAGGAGSCGCGTTYGGGGYGGHGGNYPAGSGAGGPGVVALYYYSILQRGIGGNVTTGTNALGQYWVHKFTSSGTYSA